MAGGDTPTEQRLQPRNVPNTARYEEKKEIEADGMFSADKYTITHF